jgi:hypothetical protein
MNDNGIRIWKEAVLSWHLPQGTDENNEKYIRIADVPAEVRTRRLTDIKLELYL